MKYDEIYSHVLTVESEAVKKLQDTLDMAVMDKLTDLLCTVKGNGKKVITAGCGTSGAAARKIAHSLSCVEVPAFYLSPADSVHGGMGAIQKGDVVVLVTKGGNTPEILSYLPCCKEKGAITVGVSENPASALAQSCDIYLRVGVEREPCPWNMLATASTMAVTAAFDALAIAVMQHNGYTKEQFLLIHPGGAVGEKLKG